MSILYEATATLKGKPMFTLTLLTISFISLLFTTTRLFGVICLTFLSYKYPLLLIVVIALTALYLYFKYQNVSH